MAAAATDPARASTMLVRVDGRRGGRNSRPWARVVLDGGERAEVACTDDGSDPEDRYSGDRLYICRLKLPRGGDGKLWVTDGPATGGRIMHVGAVRLRDGATSNLRVEAKVVEEDGHKTGEAAAVVSTEALGPFDPRFGEVVEAPLDGRAVTGKGELTVGRWPAAWLGGAGALAAALGAAGLRRRRRPVLDAPVEPGDAPFPEVPGLPGFAGGVGWIAGPRAMPARDVVAALEAAGVEARVFGRAGTDEGIAAWMRGRAGPAAAVVDGVPAGFWAERAEARLARLIDACAPAMAGRAAGLVLLAPVAPDRVLAPDGIGDALRARVGRVWLYDGALRAPPTGPATVGAWLVGGSWAAHARWAPRVAALATVLVCVLGGVLLAAGALFGASDTVLLLGSRTGATPGSLWSNAAAVDAIASLDVTRLFASDHIYWPSGAELVPIFGNVLVPLLAAPFQAVLGYPGYWNPFVLATIAANGLAAFRLARVTGAGPAASALAGVAFAFCPPLLGEIAAGRELQFVAFPLPIAIAAGLVALDGRRPRDGWIAGAALALATASYWFWGAFAAAVLGALYVQRRFAPGGAGLKDQLARVARLLAPVALLAVPLVIAANRGDMPELRWGRLPESLGGTTGGDLALSTLLRHGVDPDVLVLGSGGVSRVVHVATIALLLGALAVRRTRFWGLVAIVAGVVALGPYLPPGKGPGDAWLPLPGAYLYAGVPFLSRLLHPDRALVLGALAVAVVGAAAFDALAARAPRIAPGLARVLAVALAVALPAGAGLSPLPRFAFSLPDHYRQLGWDGAVAELPVGFREEALLYQPLHGRPLLGGPGELAAMEGRGRLRRAMEKDTVLAWLAQAGAPLFGVPDLTALHDAGLRYILVNSKQIDSLSQSRDAQGNGLLDIAQRVDVVFGPALFRSPDVVVYRVPSEVSVEDLAERLLAAQAK